MITIRCTYTDESFYRELVDLCEKYGDISTLGFDANFYDSKKKGYLKCKSAFAAKMDPFVGVWINNIPKRGFYSESDECTLDNIEKYLKSLSDDDFKKINSDD